jgi:hypothetical protein
MNKKTIATLSILLTINAIGMQPSLRQKASDSSKTSTDRSADRQQQKKDKKKQHWHSQDDAMTTAIIEPRLDDALLADLKADMAAAMQTIIKESGSVDIFVKEHQKIKKMVLCPICFKPECPFSREEYE